jgi:D-alanine-D-alanine ligase
MKDIAIVAGGYSSEFSVSIRSAEGLMNFIDGKKYNRYIVTIYKDKWTVKTKSGHEVNVNLNNFSFIDDYDVLVVFDYAFITIHGSPGEDGRLQGYFDMLGIPYSSCGVLAASLTFNKFVNNQYLNSHGIKTPKSIRLKAGTKFDTSNAEVLGFPVFVKPCEGGSSFGISKVSNPLYLKDAINKAFKESSEVMIEQAVKGRELTCGCFKTAKRKVVLPVTEIISENDFFDYEAKYNGKSKEITPADVPIQTAQRIQDETALIYDLIDARGIIRIDYILSDEGEPFLLEINTNPGMTSASLIPQQIKAAGLDIKDVMTDIIENC